MVNSLLLVIDHRDTKVRLEGRALRLERPDASPEHIPLGLVGLVVVHGSPLVGCEVWRELAERHIPAVLQPVRGRGPSVWIGAALGNSIELRLAQHRVAANPADAVVIARHFVAGKIQAQLRVVPQLDPQGEAARRLESFQRGSLDRLDMATTTDTLMGIEGAAASAWYNWLGGWLPDRWRFSGRNRRPPRDPVNALLSLGYTLLGGEMLRAVQVGGLDPALGFLHGVVPGRESLVLDLMEPLRPSVDIVVLGLLDELLIPTHFSYSARDGCRLNKDGRALFYRAWAGSRADWPDLLGQTADDRPAMDPHPEPGLAEAAGDEKTSESEMAEPTTSLPALCRRQVERLRSWLRPWLRGENPHG